MTERDARSDSPVATIERGSRAFSCERRTGNRFIPMHRYGIFASRWPLDEQNPLDDREPQ